MFIYLAHPIDQATVGRPRILTNVLAHLQEAIRQQGHSTFRPASAYNLSDVQPWSSEDMQHVDSINRYALFESDAVLAVLLPGIATLGTPAEIEYALQLNRPTCIVTTEKLRQTSIQLGNWASRGARVVFCSDDGMITGLNVAESLGSLPDPTQFLIDQPVGWSPPALLARGEAANLQPGKYEGDAGIDLATKDDWLVENGEYVLLDTGVHVAIPHGYFGLITGRSSTWAKYRCRVVQAVIDSGYRGELKIGIENTGPAVKFARGTRLAQIILLPTFGGKLEFVDELPEAERGLAGYGSSGH
jgi:dUTP pyrophosphatase